LSLFFQNIAQLYSHGEYPHIIKELRQFEKDTQKSLPSCIFRELDYDTATVICIAGRIAQACHKKIPMKLTVSVGETLTLALLQGLANSIKNTSASTNQ